MSTRPQKFRQRQLKLGGVIVKLIFVRHGKDDNRYRGGWSNLDLIPEGMEQAKQLAQYLKDNNQDYLITHIISSDLPRTMSTAHFISSELGLPIQKEFRIREIDNGDLAGMLNDTALEKFEFFQHRELPISFYINLSDTV